jgi:hypothetical protein
VLLALFWNSWITYLSWILSRWRSNALRRNECSSHMLYLSRPGQKSPTIKLVSFKNSQQNVHFSYGIREPCYQLDEWKPRLTRKKNAFQLSKLALVCYKIYAVTSLQTQSTMVDFQVAHCRASDCALFGQINCCYVSSCSSGILDAIALVGVSNIAVFGTHCDESTFTTWYIFCTPCFLRTLSKLSNSPSRSSNIHSYGIHRHTSIEHANDAFA